MSKNGKAYDVVIAGGGPAGAHLGCRMALLGYKVAICEKEHFPREHIGESLVPRCTIGMEEIGALEKFLASDTYVVKYGGWFDLNKDQEPFNLFFSHAAKEKDGYFRWAFHVDRARFDKLLLDHARELGVDVMEGTPVKEVIREGGTSRIVLEDGELHTPLFVEATGRRSTLVGSKRRFVSTYKNIAVAFHYADAKPAIEVDEPWNLYRKDSLERREVHEANLGPSDLFQCAYAPGHGASATAAFSFEGGWIWYIPVPKYIDGKLEITHSIGIVTDVAAMKQRDFRNVDVFTQVLKEQRWLCDLVDGAKPISDEPIVAQNYSMADEDFCNYDNGWMLIGDSAFFVDPMFASGIGNVFWTGRHASFVLDQTLKGSLSEEQLRDLWRDYREFWSTVSSTMGLMVDQWYHSIAQQYPEGGYWHKLADVPSVDVRKETLPVLVDLSILDMQGGNRAQVDSTLNQFKSVVVEGKDFETLRQRVGDLDDDASIWIDPSEVGIREGVRLWQSNLQEWPGEYWSNLPESASCKPDPYLRLKDCVRFYDKNDEHGSDVSIDVNDTNPGREVYELLTEGPKRISELRAQLTEEHLSVIKSLRQRSFVKVE